MTDEAWEGIRLALANYPDASPEGTDLTTHLENVIAIQEAEQVVMAGYIRYLEGEVERLGGPR